MPHLESSSWQYESIDSGHAFVYLRRNGFVYEAACIVINYISRCVVGKGHGRTLTKCWFEFKFKMS